MTLADFEALVLSQRPAETHWTPVTDYSFEARRQAEGPHARLILDTFAPCDLIDVGCGPGHLLKMLVTLAPGSLHDFAGMDINPTAAAAYEADIASPTFRHRGVYDLVICREVLEHLTVRQIRTAVTNLCRLSARYVYLTTRFHPHPESLLDVATSDDLDPTHITMLNQDLLRVLFVLEGFKRRADLEQRMDWKGVGRVLVYERA